MSSHANFLAVQRFPVTTALHYSGNTFRGTRLCTAAFITKITATVSFGIEIDARRTARVLGARKEDRSVGEGSFRRPEKIRRAVSCAGHWKKADEALLRKQCDRDDNNALVAAPASWASERPGCRPVPHVARPTPPALREDKRKSCVDGIFGRGPASTDVI